MPAKKVFDPAKLIKMIDDETPQAEIMKKMGFRSPIDPVHLTRDYDSLYPAKDYHTLYFGVLQTCYEI